MTDTNVQFNLRLPKSLREALMKAAADQRRSATAEAVMRLEEGLVRDGYLSPDSQELNDAQLVALVESLMERLDQVKSEIGHRLSESGKV